MGILGSIGRVLYSWSAFKLSHVMSTICNDKTSDKIVLLV